MVSFFAQIAQLSSNLAGPLELSDAPLPKRQEYKQTSAVTDDEDCLAHTGAKLLLEDSPDAMGEGPRKRVGRTGTQNYDVNGDSLDGESDLELNRDLAADEQSSDEGLV